MGNISMSDAELLQFAIENGMLNTALVQEKIEMQKRKELLEKHSYKIWEGKDGYWRTYMPDVKGRKLIKKKEQRDIEKVVIEYWETKSISLFSDRFLVWIDRQKKCGRTDNTIDKYESDYKRFFHGDKIENMPIQEITEEDLSEFIKRVLTQKEIPYRALKGMFGYLNGVFDKAIIDKLITENPCKYVDLPIFKQYCTERKPKTAKERTVSNEQKKVLINKIHLNNEKADNIARYAVELSVYTGMRVGELSGLKWEDVDFENKILTIIHSEKYNRKTSEYYISTTKNDKIRTFPITDEIKDVLERVKKCELINGWLSEFVFSDSNGRVHTRRISCCARNMTMTKEFDHTKSIHALRRTLNSNLRCNGVSSTVAASLLGHTKEVNENNYTYDITSIADKAEIVELAGKIS